MAILGTAQRLTEPLDVVFNSLNVLGSNHSEVVRDFFSRQHRTLQQQFVRVVILPILRSLADAHKEGRVDMRNQAAAALAAKMLAAVDDDDIFLPLI